MTDEATPDAACEAAATGRHGNSRRWYDPNRTVLALFAVVFALVLAWGGYVFAKATSASDTNIEQNQRLKVLERGLERMEGKLDKVLDRQPK